MKTVIAILILCLLTLAGCATVEVGRPVNYEAVKKIEIGKTTKAEVLALMGEPVRQKDSAGGESELVYGHKKATGHAIPFYAWGTAEGEKVIIKFDKAGVVQAIEKARLQK
jgi:outer membrane protein assembly factor BamE (lipoprotein component of BamABCDE complex)